MKLPEYYVYAVYGTCGIFKIRFATIFHKKLSEMGLLL